MMHPLSKNIVVITVCWYLGALLIPALAGAQLKLPKLCSDSMVLQRDAAISLWGWATPSKMVSIQFKNATYHGRAKSDGKLSCLLNQLADHLQ